MTSSNKLFWGAIASLVIAGAAFVALAPMSSRAADLPSPSKPACETVEQVATLLQSKGEKFIIVLPQDLLGVSAKTTRIMLSTLNGELVIGFEIDGCLNGPLDLGKVSPGA